MKRSPVALLVAATLCFLGVFLSPESQTIAKAASTTSVQLAPLINQAVTQRGETYFTNQISVTYQSGSVILSGDPVPTGGFGVDDAMTMTVTRPDGTNATFNHEFDVGCSFVTSIGPQDVTSLFAVGVNRVTVRLNDVCGAHEGNNPIFLTLGSATQPATNADVSLDITAAPSPFHINENATYTLVARNNGPGTATDVFVFDDIPEGSVVSTTTASQGSCTGEFTITCSLGDIAPGSSTTITINVIPKTAGWLINQPFATTTATDTLSANNRAINAMIAQEGKSSALNDAGREALGIALGPFGCYFIDSAEGSTRDGLAAGLWCLAQDRAEEVFKTFGKLAKRISAFEIGIDLGIANDPPDANFRIVALPDGPTVTLVAPGPGVSRKLADAMNALSANRSQQVGLKQALLTSVERAEGAAIAGDAISFTTQSKAAKAYGAQLAIVMSDETEVTASLWNVLHDDGIPVQLFGPDELRAAQKNVTSTGLPPDTVQALLDAGVANSAIPNVTALVLGMDPNNLPSTSASAQAQGQALAPFVDSTLPTLTITTSPQANGAGWNQTGVTIKLAAADNPGGSGVKQILYQVTGAQSVPLTAILGASGQVSVDTEGESRVTAFARDNAGNSSDARTVSVKIDKSTPEAYTQFDTAKQDLLVFGKDAGSGMQPGPIAPTRPRSVAAATWTSDDDDADARSDGDDHRAELRTYTITDAAGNTTTLVIKVKPSTLRGDHFKARLISIQYGNTPAVTFGRNFEEFDWDLARDGSVAVLDQKLRIGVGQDRQVVDAHFDVRQGQTDVLVKNPRKQPVVDKPGLDLLEMVTGKGRLSITY
jgi:uncharacterized repeat protein (TIGR01451 family)